MKKYKVSGQLWLNLKVNISIIKIMTNIVEVYIKDGMTKSKEFRFPVLAGRFFGATKCFDSLTRNY
jgi:hypothetical protein